MKAKAKIELAVKPEMKEAELCVLMALNMFDAAFPGQIRVRAGACPTRRRTLRPTASRIRRCSAT